VRELNSLVRSTAELSGLRKKVASLQVPARARRCLSDLDGIAVLMVALIVASLQRELARGAGRGPTQPAAATPPSSPAPPAPAPTPPPAEEWVAEFPEPPPEPPDGRSGGGGGGAPMAELAELRVALVRREAWSRVTLKPPSARVALGRLYACHFLGHV
jgi:hypothetical protein